MIEYIAIVVLLLIILVMVWSIYQQKNCIPTYTLENLEFEFDEEYHELIDNVLAKDNTYDSYKFLLNQVKDLKKETRMLNASLNENRMTHRKIKDDLEKKNDDISYMSHEVRTSLSGLLSFTNFLQATPLTQEQEEFCEIIDISSNELLVLVNSILDISPESNIIRESKASKKNIANIIYENTNHAPKHVLVVDDNDINKKLLAKVLESLDLKISYASNGVEAVELREKESFDIIFMDIEMPLMDGVEASKIIRKFENKHNKKAVPIVALTANTGQSDRDTYINAGMNDYLAKPIVIADVKSRLAVI